MMLESFFQDIRIGLRVLVKEKSFCALAVTVLTLGICAVTTQFAVVDGVMLRGIFISASRRARRRAHGRPDGFQAEQL
jgi:hypothetical protein